MRLRLATLCVLLLMGSAFAQQGRQNLWNPVRLKLVGPLETVTILCGSAGDTRIQIPLLSGERRDLQVPLAVEAGFVDPAVDLSWEGAGSVVWPDHQGLEAAPFVAQSNVPLPVVPEVAPVLPMPAILGLVALALLLFFMGEKPFRRLIVALAGSVLLVSQVGFVNPNSSGLVRVIEMGAQGTWKAFDSARDSMPHQPGQAIRLQVKPASTPVTWVVTEAGGGLIIEAQARGALLSKLFTIKAGMRRLQREQNALGNLQNVWSRGEGGLWTARGAWSLGMPIPGQESNGDQPPSWLVTGLPQGPEIWVGRFMDGAGPGSLPATQTWLRMRVDG